MRVLMEKALPLIRVRHTSIHDLVRWSSKAEQPTLRLVYASTESKAPPAAVSRKARCRLTCRDTHPS